MGDHNHVIRRAFTAMVALLTVAGVLHAVPARAAETRTLTIDVAQVTTGGIDPMVGGVVMQVVSDDTPDYLLLGHGATAGRYQTLFHSHPAHNMPVCWSGEEADFAELDAQIAKGLAAGLEPDRVHVQLLYTSPCDVAPGTADDAVLLDTTAGAEPARAQLPSASGVAILTNPEAVSAMIEQQMRHVVETSGITAFTVWNEPDGLYPLAPDLYLRYYDIVHSVLVGLESELGIDLQIGGPASATPMTMRVYIPLLLDHVITNGLTIDRVVFHRYAHTDGQSTTTISDITRGHVGLVQGWIDERREAAAAVGVPFDPVITVNEWGWDATAREDVARTGVGAAFAVSHLATFADLKIGGADYFAVQDNKAPPNRCVEPCEASGTDMIGYGLLDRTNAKRPAYHAFEFFHRLGVDRVAAVAEGPQLGDKQEWGALAARGADGVVRLLLWNFDPRDEGVTVAPQLALSGMDVASVGVEQLTGDMTVGAQPNAWVLDASGLAALELAPNTTTLLTFVPAGSGCERAPGCPPCHARARGRCGAPGR